MNGVGRRLKLARRYLKLTKSYIAMQLNITTEHLEAMEDGMLVPSRDQLNKFAQLYGIEVDELQDGLNPDRCIWDFKALRAHFLSCSTADQKAIVDLIIMKSRLKASRKSKYKTLDKTSEGAGQGVQV